MKILVLDDDDVRHNGFRHEYWHTNMIHVYTYKECVEQLEKSLFDVAFLDHDLNLEQYHSRDENGRELTGLDAAKYIVTMPSEKRPKIVIVHSWNPVGATEMYQILREAGIEVHRWEFNSTSFPKLHGK